MINTKEKGFTLIELLAVIVVLAVLALIAVPIVLNIINKANKQAEERSIESYARALDYAISECMMENPKLKKGDIIVDNYEVKVSSTNEVCAKIDVSKTTEITGCTYEVADNEKGYNLMGCNIKDNYYNYIDGKVVSVDNKTPEKKETAVETLLKKANATSVTNYTNGNTHEMYTFNHDATTQTEALADYRYIGNDPYNYVKFNNELWRIIGIFEVEDGNGNKEQRIKIIRDESIGNMKWDSNDVNEWPAATLNTYLNGDYYNSLSDEAKRVIGNTKYYLGGRAYDSTTHWGTATDIYTWERGTTVYTGRSTNWIGKIGLMYPSDYAYTYAIGVDDKCYTETYNCRTSNTDTTPTKGWLYNSAYQWLISPISASSNGAFYVYSAGCLYGNRVSDANGVRPSIYLISGIGIEKGTGTEEDPYTLKQA